MNTQWKFPFWENYQKDKITCKMIITGTDGKVTSSTANVSKYDSAGEVNKNFTEILVQNKIEDIDKNTTDREERHRIRHEKEKRIHLERIQAKKLEKLFNSKLEVFEIDGIKKSKNRKLKAKIRKSKNEYEMMAYTVILLQDEINNEESENT